MHRKDLTEAILTQAAFIVQPMDRDLYGVWGDMLTYNPHASWYEYLQLCNIKVQLEEASSNA
jgi:hypothetical protein